MLWMLVTLLELETEVLELRDAAGKVVGALDCDVEVLGLETTASEVVEALGIAAVVGLGGCVMNTLRDNEVLLRCVVCELLLVLSTLDGIAAGELEDESTGVGLLALEVEDELVGFADDKLLLVLGTTDGEVVGETAVELKDDKAVVLKLLEVDFIDCEVLLALGTLDELAGSLKAEKMLLGLGTVTSVCCRVLVGLC